MTSLLSPGYLQGPHVDEQANAELETALRATGARFGTVEYAHHHAPDDLGLATAEQLANAGGIAPGRRVLHLPGRTWAATPDTCTDFSEHGEWVLGGMLLVCPGCGLDCT